MMGLRGNRPPEMPQSSCLGAFAGVGRLVRPRCHVFRVANSHLASLGSGIEGGSILLGVPWGCWGCVGASVLAQGSPQVLDPRDPSDLAGLISEAPCGLLPGIQGVGFAH